MAVSETVSEKAAAYIGFKALIADLQKKRDAIDSELKQANTNLMDLGLELSATVGHNIRIRAFVAGGTVLLVEHERGISCVEMEPKS